MSTTASQGTSQTTTRQIPVPPQTGNSASKHSGSAIESFQIDSVQHRIDRSSANRDPHYRANQLDEFTNWLTDEKRPQPSPAPTAESSTVAPATGQITIPGMAGGLVHRIDAAAGNTQPVRKPHFETSNYVAPQADQANEVKDLEYAFQHLKADGQLASIESPATQTSKPLGFAWSDVTSRLLGSPAILNLETNVLRGLNGNPCRLLVASADKSNGGTTVAITLARQLASRNNRVLIVDANLSNSTLARQLGIAQNYSWLHSINQRRSPAELIIEDRSASIALLPLSPINARINWPEKIFDELAKIIDSVAWDYDSIIFDVGTVDQLVAEISRPGRLGAMTLLVTNQTVESNEFFMAKSKLLNSGADNLLVVKNFSRANATVQAKVG